MINNACATQALINILCNVEHDDVNLGTTLTELKEFTAGFDAQMKGLTINNSEPIRTVHNSFSRYVLLYICTWIALVVAMEEVAAARESV